MTHCPISGIKLETQYRTRGWEGEDDMYIEFPILFAEVIIKSGIVIKCPFLRSTLYDVLKAEKKGEIIYVVDWQMADYTKLINKAKNE